VVLTDEQITVLDARLDEFRNAGHQIREKITLQLYNDFWRALPLRQRKKFNHATGITVRTPTATLGYSDTFLAYSSISLWPSKASRKGICSRSSKSDR
jgi:hypothetical protein